MVDEHDGWRAWWFMSMMVDEHDGQWAQTDDNRQTNRQMDICNSSAFMAWWRSQMGLQSDNPSS